MITDKAKYTIVLVSNGKTDWNYYNIFTGWHDIALSKQGHQEAKQAGKYLKDMNFTFDIGITSALLRSHQTLDHILEELQLSGIPIIKSWRLNERHYGSLQGLRKDETIKIHGEEQVKIWRRSYEVRPPAMTQNDPEFLAKNPLYKEIPLEYLPTSECLKDTEERVLPFWSETISNEIREGKKIIVSAHGSSLRAMIKHLMKLSDEDIVELEIPTAVPLVLELDEDLEVVNSYCLLTEEDLKNRSQSDEKYQQEAQNLEQIAENSEPVAESQGQLIKNPEQVAENPEQLADNIEQPAENLEQTDENCEQVVENQAENLEQIAETRQKAAEIFEPAAENPEKVSENQQQVAEKPEYFTETLQQAAENAEPVAESQEQVTKNREQVTQNHEQQAIIPESVDNKQEQTAEI